MMAKGLLDLITQNQPHFQTNQALLVIGLQNDFIQPDGRLPVSTKNGFLERINLLAPQFRQAFSNVIWVQTLYEADRLGEGDAVVVGGLADGVESSSEEDDDRPNDLLPPTQSRSSRNKQRALDLLKKVSTRRKVAPREATSISEASPSPATAPPGDDEELFLLQSHKKGPACQPNTPGADFADSVKATIAPSDTVFATTNYSAFSGTNLLTILRTRLVTELFVCGCLTNVSVLATVSDAVQHGIRITIVGDCLGFRKQSRHDEAFKRMIEVFDANVADSADVLLKKKSNQSRQSTEEERHTRFLEDEESLEGLVAKLNLRSQSPSTIGGSRKNSYARPGSALNGRQRGASQSSRAESRMTTETQLSDDQFAEMLSKGAKPVREAEPTAVKQSLVKSKIRMRSRTDKGKKEDPERKEKEKDKKPEASSRSTAAKSGTVQPPTPTRQAETPVDPVRPPTVAKAESSDRLRTTPGKREHALKGSVSHPVLSANNSTSHVTRLSPASPSKAAPSGDSNSKTGVKPPPSPIRAQIPIEAEQTSDSAPSSACKTPIMTKNKKLQSLANFPVLRPGDRIAEGDSRIIYDFLPPDLRHPTDTSKPLQDLIFRQLYNEVHWQRMLHQAGEVPRLVCCQGVFGADGSMPVYRHPTDQVLPLLHFSPKVQVIRKQAEKLVGHPLNHVLIQLYRTGEDYISEHSDKTLDIVRGSSIVNVSFGAQRTMRLRTKKTAKPNGKEKETGEEEARNTQRVAMPHNSMFVLGLESNKKWLHGINADKRLAAERSEAEKAYGGMRISLTFRHIGTFIDAENSTIWGQGATAKSKDDPADVINNDECENEKIVKASSKENHNADFDWDEHYGDGFDILHFRNAPDDIPLLFASNVPAETKMVQFFLWEQKIPHKLIECPIAHPEYEMVGNEGRRAWYRDNDVNHSEVGLAVAILSYLNHYHPLDRDDRGREVLASAYEVVVLNATAWTGWINMFKNPDAEAEAEFANTLGVLEERQAYGPGPYTAGRRFSIADCCMWPFLDEIIGTWEGWSEERFPKLTEFYRMLWKKKKATLSRIRPELPEIRREAKKAEGKGKEKVKEEKVDEQEDGV